MDASRSTVVTTRLVVRPPTELDRERFVELFGDDEFMIFSEGVLSPQGAAARFDRMLALCGEIPFGKQPVVERASGAVVGYTGVDRIELKGQLWLEWGYRLIPRARGKGYATEASAALLEVAAQHYNGQIIALIHPENERSHRVIRKLGFAYWHRTRLDAEERDLYRLEL